MKKITAIFLALILVLCLAAPALAVTPALGVPDMPELPDLSDDIHVTIPDEVLDKWFEEHPIEIVRPTEPPAPHEPMEKPQESPVRPGWMDWLLGWCRWLRG